MCHNHNIINLKSIHLIYILSKLEWGPKPRYTFKIVSNAFCFPRSTFHINSAKYKYDSRKFLFSLQHFLFPQLIELHKLSMFWVCTPVFGLTNI